MRRRVLIADDHPLVRDALRMAVMARFPSFVVEEAVAIEPAEQIVKRHNDFALLLLDYQLPDSSGFSGFFRLQHLLGPVPIAIVSAFDDDRLVDAAKAIGAAGFLSKSKPLDEIAGGIERLVAGQTVFPPVKEQASDLREMSERLESLSKAQKRVIALLVSGHLNKQIAGDLDVSEATVKAHLTAIFRKLGVNNRLQAILAVKPLLAPETDA
jgi:DNA-binding NarL/FixJ family response regulator